MKCKKIRLLLSEYARGELDRREMVRVKEHLEHCPRCQEARRDLAELEERIKIPLGFQGVTLSPQFEMKLSSRIKALKGEKSGFTIPRWAYGFGMACFLLLSLAILLNYPDRLPAEGFNKELARLPLEELEAIDDDLSKSEEFPETADLTYKDMLKTMLKDQSPENIETAVLEDASLEEMLEGLSPEEEWGIIEAIIIKLNG
jgi:hypothetical protein